MPDYLDNLKDKYKDPTADFTEDEKDYFEERSGIYQYDAGMSREDAERFAIHSVEARRARIQVEKEVRESFRDYPMKEADRG